MKVCVFFENGKTDLHQIFFQDLGENTCSLNLHGEALHSDFNARNVLDKVILSGGNNAGPVAKDQWGFKGKAPDATSILQLFSYNQF